jgi:S1-C subfamily serine protease
MALGIGMIGVFIARYIDRQPAPQANQSVYPTTVVSKPLPSNWVDDLMPDERNNIEVFQKVSPAVVHITTSSIRRDSFFFSAYERQDGMGTGFVWDKQGHIITNYHVCAQANKATIRMINQKTYSAKIVGVDVHKDIAVLKIDAPPEELVPIELVQDGYPIVVGQKAIAIGNPFGLDHSLTVGVVSALEREIEALSGLKIMGVIQTDAAINPGNSGGPLLNSRGRLIGVNTQIVSGSGSSAGIGFAVPADIVKYVVPQLIEYGEVRRVGLGVRLLRDDMKVRLGIRHGVVIEHVYPGGAANKAGLKGILDSQKEPQFHVITAINGRKVDSRMEILNLLINFRLNEEITLDVLYRNEESSQVKLKLQEL